MNKKIKIIELLNKIANGEDIPTKIKKEYLESNSFEDLIDNLKYFDKDFSKTLNDEVEILENNTEEIEEIKFELQADNFTANQLKYFFNMNRKVDEIRKAVNEMRKEKK